MLNKTLYYLFSIIFTFSSCNYFIKSPKDYGVITKENIGTTEENYQLHNTSTDENITFTCRFEYKKSDGSSWSGNKQYTVGPQEIINLDYYVSNMPVTMYGINRVLHGEQILEYEIVGAFVGTSSASEE